MLDANELEFYVFFCGREFENLAFGVSTILWGQTFCTWLIVLYAGLWLDTDMNWFNYVCYSHNGQWNDYDFAWMQIYLCSKIADCVGADKMFWPSWYSHLPKRFEYRRVGELWWQPVSNGQNSIIMHSIWLTTLEFVREISPLGSFIHIELDVGYHCWLHFKVAIFALRIVIGNHTNWNWDGIAEKTREKKKTKRAWYDRRLHQTGSALVLLHMKASILSLSLTASTHSSPALCLY